MTPEEARKNNAVLAIGSKDSKRQFRLEIDEFLADNDMTNLFLLALAAMQVEDKSLKGPTEDWWSFYSLAGIHGMPDEAWAGIPNSATGYCTHGQFVFPPWHRVYINMFEQAVYLKMKDIAKGFTVEPYKTQYAIKVEKFRLPYWDPLMPRYDSLGGDKGKIPDGMYSEMRWGLPQILAQPFVHVRKAPDGTPDDKFPNPLYKFTMPKKDVLDAKGRTTQLVLSKDEQDGYHPNLYINTLRTPRNGETVLGDLNDPNLKQEGLHINIRNENQNLGDKMWKLLGRYKDTKGARGGDFDNTTRSWETFAAHNVMDVKTNMVQEDARGRPKYNGDPNNTAVSLESWHDAIHGLIGWGYLPWKIGNMTRPPIAAFDPIFWLHHNNVDRLFAIYQALNPDSYVRSKSDTKQPKYGYLDSPLIPFNHPTEKRFYTAADVRDWKGLGYAVPGNSDLDKDGQNRVAEYLNKWYNWIAQKSAPPPEVLAHWPKKLKSSFALYGKSAEEEQPVRFEALSVSGLVTQEFSSLSLESDNEVSSTYNVVAEYPGLPPNIVSEKQILTYTATVRVRKFAFDGSFNVHLFMGTVNDEKLTSYFSRRNEIGYVTVFASEQAQPCIGCQSQRQGGLIFEDGVPLSTMLYRFLKTNEDEDGPPKTDRQLESLKPDDVVPFLTKNLQWRIAALNGVVDDPERIEQSGLEVTVSMRVYELPTPENPLGAYYPSVDIPQITSGKLGGARETQAIDIASLPQLN